MKEVGRDQLLKVLPEYRDAWVVVHPDQSVREIINEVLEAHKDFAPYYDEIALYFDCDDIQDTCRCIYDFLKSNIKYKEEKEEDQTSALPTGILIRGYGDCKHYAGFSAGILDAINRLTGKKIDFCYRFASYNLFSKTPHHVFVVVKDRDGSEIWIDPTPGAQTQAPVWQIDKKVKGSTMALRRNIAGIGVTIQNMETAYVQPVDAIYVDPAQLPTSELQLLAPEVVTQIEEQNLDSELTPELQSALEVLMQYGVVDNSGNISDQVLHQLSLTLPQSEFENVAAQRQILQHKLTEAVVQGDAALGSFISDLWRGVKKVSLAIPRNAFLSLVAINVFGLGTKMYHSIYNDDGTFFQPNQDKLYRFWNKLGGDWHNLNNAIKSGNKKHAVLGSTGETYGVLAAGAAATTAAAANPAIAGWVAAATAIIAAVTPLIKSLLAAKSQAGMLNPGIDPNTGLPIGMNVDQPSASTDPIQWIKDNPVTAGAIGIGAYLLLSPSKGVAAVTPKNNKKTLGLLLIGGAGLYFLSKKNSTTVINTGGGSTTDTGSGSDTGTGSGTGSDTYTGSDTASTTTTGPSQLEKDTYATLLSILQADPWIQRRVFPGDFFDAVQQDYVRQLDGYPRTPDYAAGLPGSFMSVSDAWFVPVTPYPSLFPNWTGITPQTHDALWSTYSAFRSKFALQNL